jgi:hypothetical protein
MGEYKSMSSDGPGENPQGHQGQKGQGPVAVHPAGKIGQTLLYENPSGHTGKN